MGRDFITPKVKVKLQLALRESRYEIPSQWEFKLKA